MAIVKLCIVLALSIPGSIAKSNPSEASIRKHETARVAEKQHEINENIRRFKETLESLRTTVDFEPVAI